MDLVPKPVISWAGHETLVGELETRCSLTIAKEPAMWRHSKHRGQYPVRIDASFTRFVAKQLQSPIKVLCTGRPIRPVGSFQPLLYIYAISNNHTEYTTGGGRNKIASWLGHLQAGNISDWVILMIDADAQSAGPKMWQRSTVIQRIKKDFNITTEGFHFLQLPDPRAVEEKVFQDAWTIMMRALRKIILEVYHLTIVDYDLHLKLLEEARFTAGWDFFEYLDRKEELARLYAVLGGYEDALHEYCVVETFFSDCAGAVEVSESEQLPWIRQLISVTKAAQEVPSYLSCFPVVPSMSDSDQAVRIRDRQATLFDIRTYLLSKQLELLSLLGKLHKIPARVYSCISTTLNQAENLKLSTEPVFESCWAFLCSLYCLELLRQRASTNAHDVASSINIVLFAAFGPNVTNRSEELHAGQADLAYQPYNNVFLRASSSDNALAEPLAVLADVVYTTITSQSKTSGSHKTKHHHHQYHHHHHHHTKTAQVPRRLPPVCMFVVDLWLMAFMHLTRMGYLLQMWHTDKALADSAPSHTTALHALEQAILTCAQSPRVDLPTFGHSIHKRLFQLLSSRTTYTEVYVAMGQTLIGFFKLINRPNKAIYVSSTLASFLQTVDAKQQASALYAHALSTYMRDGWPQLSTFACLRLACCLRSMLNDLQRKQLRSDSALARYLHCCFSLSCTHPDNLAAITKSSQLAPESKPDFALSFHVQPDSPTPEQLMSPDFWWCQAIKVLTLFPTDHLWDCSNMMQSPFKLIQVELNEASAQGAQVITVTLEVTTHLSFVARVSASASYPRSDDWQSVMNYGHVTQLLGHLTDATSNANESDSHLSVEFSSAPASQKRLSTVELRRLGSLGSRSEFHSEPRSPKSAHSSSDLSFLENSTHNDPSSSGSVAKSTDDLAPTMLTRRKSSFLDVAASWATRPAWKSQDSLHLKPDSSTSTDRLHARDGAVHRPKLSPIFSPGFPIADRSQSVFTPPSVVISPVDVNDEQSGGMHRRASSSELRTATTVHRSFSFSESGLAGRLSVGAVDLYANADCAFLTDYRRPRVAMSDQTSMTFLVDSKPVDLIRLDPGVNRITLVSQTTGFLLPTDIRITVFSRTTKGSPVSPLGNRSDSALHLAYRVQAEHYHSSWSNQDLLNALLPKLYESNQKEPLKTIRVILGLRRPINLQLELGRLGLPVSPNTGINLYRIVHNLNPQPTTITAPSGGPARVPKVINDYYVQPLDANSPANAEAGCRESKDRVSSAPRLLKNDYRLDLQDGPVFLEGNMELLPDNGGDVTMDRKSRFRFSRPLWIRALTDKDEFAISMPSGYLCHLPVSVIRPLALTLSVYTFQRTDTVVFAIRIACMDLHDTAFEMSSPIQQPSLKPSMPLTFKLTKCQLLVTAPNIPESVLARADSQTALSSTDPDGRTGLSNGTSSASRANSVIAADTSKEVKKPRNCMVGIPVDPRNVEAVVNRLCPVTLLWKLRFSEFRPFVNSVLERFSEPPEARFQCTFNRLDDPTCESQLSFHRRISPIRQPPGEKPPSLAGLLARSRKERGSS